MKIPDDPFILELLPEFVETWISDIHEQFEVIIAEKKSDDLYRFGHTIKGSCFQFGLDEIAALGIEMMGYARANDFDKANELGPKILQNFKDVKVFIDSKLISN